MVQDLLAAAEGLVGVQEYGEVGDVFTWVCWYQGPEPLNCAFLECLHCVGLIQEERGLLFTLEDKRNLESAASPRATRKMRVWSSDWRLPSPHELVQEEGPECLYHKMW